jgi:hypothetical protein
MVCPMCVTAAIVANAPGLAAAVGGFAAAKAAMGQHERRASPAVVDTRPLATDKPVVRPLVERKGLQVPLTMMSREDW